MNAGPDFDSTASGSPTASAVSRTPNMFQRVVLTSGLVLLGMVVGTNGAAGAPTTTRVPEVRLHAGTSGGSAAGFETERSFAVALEQLRSRLTVEDIATLVGVTRRAVYDWLKGENVRPQHQRSILRLADLARGRASSPALVQHLRRMTDQMDSNRRRVNQLQERAPIGTRSEGLFAHRSRLPRKIQPMGDDGPTEVEEAGSPFAGLLGYVRATSES